MKNENILKIQTAEIKQGWIKKDMNKVHNILQ
jgi:hypothetical protein